MTDTLLGLIATYGPIFLGLVTFLSCLALPVPASLLMMTGGGFVASGDLTLTGTMGAALAGALLGDQAGFWAGRLFRAPLERWIDGHPTRHALQVKAHRFILRWGGPGVFLSRWLISPLGPYVNLLAGGTALHWPRFTLWGTAGEVVWVTLYVSLGYVFAGNISELAQIMGNASGLLAGLAVMAASGAWLWHARHPHRAQ